MPDEKSRTVKFHYIKSNFFRVVHADGAIGGITPAGNIFMSLYSERGAIPQIMIHDVSESGELGPERIGERAGREGIVREVDIGVEMSPAAAMALITWLQEKLEIASKLKTSRPMSEGIH